MESKEPSRPKVEDGAAAGHPGAEAGSGQGQEDVGAAEDALRRLERRLDQASEAAERLIAEAASEATAGAGRAQGGVKPPPAGWQAPDSEQSGSPAAPDLDALVQVLRSLRDLIPPDLQRRLADALREVLLAIRALIDWYVERLEQRREKPVQVEDIPIL